MSSAPATQAAHKILDPSLETSRRCSPSLPITSSKSMESAQKGSELVPHLQPSNPPNLNSTEQASQFGEDLSAAGYGTRSRNRPGGARPNYADDREVDLEIEAAAKQSKMNKKATAAAAAAATAGQAQDAEASPVRNGFTAVNAGASTTNNSSSSATPVSGSYNVLPPPQPSKKRKQPGSNTTVSQPQPPSARNRVAPGSRALFLETNMLSFDRCRSKLNNKRQLVADDGTTIATNDHMYFICEPPGEPYYLARIMEFLHANNDANGAVEAVRVNWFYRPKDIQRRVQDTRVVFASMHSDTCPLTSMRGKCSVQHISNIDDMDEYRKKRDSFWFDKFYDRYMLRYYEVIPTSKVVNVPRKVKKVLDERWKFILVEIGRGRDLTSASKMCKRCGDFAANHNSVDCAVCKNTYHMQCVRPPLLKKPARGFAWACAPCSRAQELRLEGRDTPTDSVSGLVDMGDDDLLDEDEDEQPSSRDQATRENSVGQEQHPPPTAAQLAQANLWPYRYLGIHSRAEDALDYDDRIYPRASSRLGPRHQANVNVWHGRPIEFVKPAEGKKKYKPIGGSKKDSKSLAAGESDKREKRPKWVLDEPPGFVARGHDDPIEVKGKKEHTAQLTFKMPTSDQLSERGLDGVARPEDAETTIDDYMEKCAREIAPLYNVRGDSVDLETKAIEKLQEMGYDVDKALEAMRHLSLRGDLKLPDLNREEIKRFEEGVAKYGSELHLVARHVSPTIKEGRIVRFYYMWKKSPRGKEIWGNFEGRKSKKESKRLEKDGIGTKLLDDVANDVDDSAFDNDKAAKVKRGFVCKFCNTKSSRIWRRAPATAPGTLVPRDPASKNAKDKAAWLTLALCGKCAYLWRRYAIQYESIEEIAKKIASAGGRASKRKVDEELMRTVIEAQDHAGDVITKNSAQMATAVGVEVPAAMVESDEQPKKKPKVDRDAMTPEVVAEKKKAPEKPPELEPLKPEAPRVKEHPCAVCHVIDNPEHKMLKCRDCRLHAHAACYGVDTVTGSGPWYCDMCKNDHNTHVSTNYECVLCPVRVTPQELMEPPKVSHKKKTEREREKERAEREMVQEAGRRWRQDQEAAGRPVNPREPLKRTAWNNWMHVTCALWTKEIKFGDAERLDAAEGVGFIPHERFDTPCKLCRTTGLPTVSCHQPACNVNFHVGCAHAAAYRFGFDVAPVKGSRRDSVAVMRLDQEAGLVVPGIWCPDHNIPTMVHNMLETAPSELTVLQEFARTYKQVDSTATGTVRRAAQFTSNVPVQPSSQPASNRRASLVNGSSAPQGNGERVSNQPLQASPSPLSPVITDSASAPQREKRNDGDVEGASRKCCSCWVESSPKWWPIKSARTTARQARHSPVGTDVRPGSRDDPVQLNGLSRAPIETHVSATTSGNYFGQATNGLVKPEPTEVGPADVPSVRDEVLFQCHKCHIQKKTPLSSPFRVRRKEKPPPEPVPEPLIFQSGYPPAPPQNIAPLNRPQLDGSTHSHASINGHIPHHPPWQPPAPVWPHPLNRALSQSAPAPPPPPPPLYGSPYQPVPPMAGPDYRPPYTSTPTAPPHYGVHTLPPIGHAQPQGMPQHSPPHASYAHPLHAAPGSQMTAPPPRAPPSPGNFVDRGPLPPSHGVSKPPTASGRSYGPDPGASTAHSPYSTHPRPSLYQPLPPPVARPPSTQSLVHIAQAATEHPTHPQAHSRPRHANGDPSGTPRLAGARPPNVPESPSMSYQRPTTPAENIREGRSSVGPGASASPSLRNLLS